MKTIKIGEIIRIDEDDPIRKVYKGNIYDKKKKTRQTLPEMERWRMPGRQAAKPKFLIKVALDRIPVVVPLMMMRKQNKNLGNPVVTLSSLPIQLGTREVQHER